MCSGWGVAAGYEEGGAGLRYTLAPNGSRFTQSPRRGPPGAEKNSGGREAKAEATEDQKGPGKILLGGALDLALELLPQVKAAAGKFRRALRWTSSVCG